jgi:hypothetical protein
MTRYGRRGVAMILVIMLIGLMGITLATLGHSCRLMLAQTELQRQGAVDRNLVLSGLAWAKVRQQGSGIGGQKDETANGRMGETAKSEEVGTTGQDVQRTAYDAEHRRQEAVTLDVNDLAAGAGLTVTIVDTNDAGRTIHVTTFVPSPHYDLNRTRPFQAAQP